MTARDFVNLIRRQNKKKGILDYEIGTEDMGISTTYIDHVHHQIELLTFPAESDLGKRLNLKKSNWKTPSMR